MLQVGCHGLLEHGGPSVDLGWGQVNYRRGEMSEAAAVAGLQKVPEPAGLM